MKLETELEFTYRKPLETKLRLSEKNQSGGNRFSFHKISNLGFGKHLLPSNCLTATAILDKIVLLFCTFRLIFILFVKE